MQVRWLVETNETNNVIFKNLFRPFMKAWDPQSRMCRLCQRFFIAPNAFGL
jgi:hypothetical protein